MPFPNKGTAVTTSATGTGSPVVVSVTTGASETYLLARVGTKVAGNPAATVASLTFGATPLAELGMTADANASLRGTLLGAVVAANTTADVTVTYAGANSNTVVAIVPYRDVISVGTAVGGTTEAGATLSVTLADVSRARCVDMILVSAGDNTPTTLQTLEFTAFDDSAHIIEMSGSFKGAEAAMLWSDLNHINESAVMIAVPLVGLGAGTGVRLISVARR